MATTELPVIPLQRVPGTLVQRALQVLADTTGATAVLFDAAGELVAGPIAGNAFAALLLTRPAGRDAVLAGHRAALPQAAPEPTTPLLDGDTFTRFPIRIVTTGQCAGTLTLGDRPHSALSEAMLERISVQTDIPLGDLAAAARDLRAWPPHQIEVARQLAALLADLFAELCTRQQDLRDRIEELSAVYNIAGMLADTHDLQQILNKTARIVCEVMNGKACSIRMLDETSGTLTIKAVHNLSMKYLAKGPVIVDQNPIDQAALAGEMVRIADAPSDPRTQYPEQAREEGIVSGLVCGLIYRGKGVGVVRVYTGEPHEFSPFEEALLRGVAAQAAAAIVHARLMADRLEAERYQRQIAYAGQVQRRMIPANPPVLPHVEIGCVYRPTYNVGGDFYDFICLPKGNLGIGIADVSGKGVPASLLMASIRTALRVYAYFMYDIDRIMAEVNKHVCRETTVSEFATIFYGVITPDARRFTYCNAGHDPPLLLRDGRIIHLGTGGMVVGVDPQAVFERELLTLRPGDVVLLYTDGVVEALNFSDERFGRERLAASLVHYAAEPAQLVAQNILWDIRRFRGLADRTDDISLVVLKIK